MWDYAKAHDFVIVTSDADFEELSLIYGSPPSIVWLRGANLSSLETFRLDENAEMIQERVNAGIACVEIVKSRR